MTFGYDAFSIRNTNLSSAQDSDKAQVSHLVATKEELTHPRVGRHQWVRSKRRGTVGWKRFRFGDEGVVPLVIHSRVYKPTVHSPRAVS